MKEDKIISIEDKRKVRLPVMAFITPDAIQQMTDEEYTEVKRRCQVETASEHHNDHSIITYAVV